MKITLAYSLFVLVCGLIGLSLTRTNALRDGDPLLFSSLAVGAAALMLCVFHLSKDRIASALPPQSQLRGLKIFLFGFSVAVAGWLITAFISFSAGAALVMLAAITCAAGIAIHYRLMFESK